MHWEVRLEGGPIDLRMLAERLQSERTFVIETKDGFVLRSQELGQLNDAHTVRERGTTIATSLSATAKVLLGACESIRACGATLVRDDGKRDIHMWAEPGEFSLRILPVRLVVRRSDGTEEACHPGDRVGEWLDLSFTNETVEKALRLRGRGDLNWTGLYRLFEVIEADTGRGIISARGWITEKQSRRFKHTANSVAAAGDEARHGKEATQPPSDPMSLGDARLLIDRLLSAWLNSKCPAKS